MYYYSRSIIVFFVLFLFCTNSDKKEKVPVQTFTHRDVEDLLELSKSVSVPTPEVPKQESENPVMTENDSVALKSNPFCDSVYVEESKTKRSIRLISTEDRNKFLSLYFSTPDPYCYQEISSNSLSTGIRLQNRTFCVFYGNPMQLCSAYTTYLDSFENESTKIEGMHTLLASALHIPDSIFDKNSCDTILEIGLMKITGIPPFLNKLNFKHINPAIIEWGIKNLLPAPEDSIMGKSCKEIYTALYAEFLRNLYFTLCWLEFTPNRIEQEYTAYIDSCKSPTFNGIRYLEKRFYRSNPNFNEEPDHFDPSPVYAGFWLRRFGDGSFQTIKNGVITLLETYDKDILSDVFYKDKLIRVPSVNDYDKEESSDTMILSFVDFDLYITGCIRHYDTQDSLSFDTILLHQEDYICSDDKKLFAAIRKQKDISDISVTVAGKYGFFVQGDPGKGGIGLDYDFDLIPTGKVSFQLADFETHSLDEVFKKENIIMSNVVKKDLKNRQEKYSANGSWNEVEPAEMFVDLKWNNALTDKNKHKVIKVVYSYGD